MDYKKLTGVVIVGIVVVGVAYDVWVYCQAGTEGTISWWVYEQSHNHPSIPFGIGYLCGHFFWQMKKKITK